MIYNNGNGDESFPSGTIKLLLHPDYETWLSIFLGNYSDEQYEIRESLRKQFKTGYITESGDSVAILDIIRPERIRMVLDPPLWCPIEGIYNALSVSIEDEVFSIPRNARSVYIRVI